MDAKQIAAYKAVEYVKDGMVLGLGSGSTAIFAIQAIGERVKNEGLRVRGIPTSAKSRDLAMQLGIPLIDFGDTAQIDLTIDGADEVSGKLDLIKGGGGALLREKIVAASSDQLLIICDEGKLCKSLGKFPLPIAIIPFGWQITKSALDAFCVTNLRKSLTEPDKPFITDDNLLILDMHIEHVPDAVADFEEELKRRIGVVEVGLFVGMATRVIVGYTDGHTTELIPDMS